MAKSATRRTPRRTRMGARSGRMIFTRRNYTLLIVGVVFVVFGYTIMRIENDVHGFISLYVAPLLILGGYLEVIYAILWRPKDSREESKAVAS
jgi:hypothetical protein